MAMAPNGNEQWAALPQPIVDAARAIAEAGKYDDAIFAAFRYVESQIQERIGSSSIGRPLIIEAFGGTPPRIQIGAPRDYQSIHDLFAGALGHIRNDRGHKNRPAIPCATMATCMLYVNFAALLLYLLSKDEAVLPRVHALAVHQSSTGARVELHGANLNGHVEVHGGDNPLHIVKKTDTVIEALLPDGFIGEVVVRNEAGSIYSAQCDSRGLYSVHENVYEIIECEIPLFSDASGVRKIDGYVGMLVSATEGGFSYTCVRPTIPGRYRAGQFVSAGKWAMERYLGETWYLQKSGSIHNAWQSSAIWLPEVLPGTPRMSAVVALPKAVSVEPGARLTLSSRGIQTIGTARIEKDLTKAASWSSGVADVAFVKNGVLFAKSFGETEVQCRVDGFQSSISVRVEKHVCGDKAIYFEGLRQTQQICFSTNDDLYITNQSHRVYRLRRSGGLDVAVQITNPHNATYGADCIAIDAKGGLYVTAPEPRRVLYFHPVGDGFSTARVLGLGQAGVKKSIAVTSNGDVVVGVMGAAPGQGHVLTIAPDGTERTFSARDSAHLLALGPGDRIYVSTTRHKAIDVFSLDGTQVDSISHGLDEAVGGLAVGADGSIYVGGFASGRLLCFTREADAFRAALISDGLGTIAGIAIDSEGHKYVSDFATGCIWTIY